MPTPIQSSQFRTLLAKQTGKGVIPSSAVRQLQQTGGGLAINETIGKEMYGDGKRFASPFVYKSEISGGGKIDFQGAPSDLARVLAYMYGTESVTTVSGRGQHVITAGNNPLYWFLASEVGTGASNAVRVQGADAAVTQVVISCSRQQLPVRCEMDVLSISPTYIDSSAFDALAAGADVAEHDPFLLTDMEGTFTMDGTVFEEINALTWTITDGRTLAWGDKATPFDFAPGRGSTTFDLALILDDAVLAKFNKIHFGSATPATGTAPSKAVFSGALDFKFTRGTGTTLEEVHVTANVKYSTQTAVQGQVNGGSVEVAISADVVDYSTFSVTATTAETTSYLA